MHSPRPWLAFVLSFVLPGAGLLYLRKWKLAIVNFVLVQGVISLLFFGVGESGLVEHIHYVFLAMAAASGGYAHGVALSCVRNLRSSPEMPAPG